MLIAYTRRYSIYVYIQKCMNRLISTINMCVQNCAVCCIHISTNMATEQTNQIKTETHTENVLYAYKHVCALWCLSFDATSINKYEGARSNRHTGCTHIHCVVAFVVVAAASSAFFVSLFFAFLSLFLSYNFLFCSLLFLYTIKSHYNDSCYKTFEVYELFSKYILHNCNNS